MSAEGEVPPHLRQPPHPPPDQDCDDMHKIVVTPVYRGRLEESHERTRRGGWRRKPWYVVRYQRWTRDAQAFMDNHGQMIFASLTYITGALMVIILLGVALRMVISSPSRQKSRQQHTAIIPPVLA